MDVVLNKLKAIIEELNSSSVSLGGSRLFFSVYQRLRPVVIKGFGEESFYLIEIERILEKTTQSDSFVSMSYYFEELQDVVIRMIDELEMGDMQMKSNTSAEAQLDAFWQYMHKSVQSLAKTRFNSGFYADAVLVCLKEANVIIKTYVRSKTGKEVDGAALMTFAFSVQNPVIILADLQTESGRNVQQGYMKMFEGAMIGIRNPKSHENFNLDKSKAIHFLFIASFIFIKLEETGVLGFGSIYDGN